MPTDLGLPAPLRPHMATVARSFFRKRPSVHGISGQTAFMAEFLSRERLKWPRPDIEIRPDMRGISAFSPWQIGLAMRRGEEAARRALPAIQRLLARLQAVEEIGP